MAATEYILNNVDNWPRMSYFSESESYSALRHQSANEPAMFVYSVGDYSLLNRRRLPMYTPMWQFADVCYSDDEEEGPVPEVDDAAVDLYVNRILLACTMNKDEEGSFGIDDPSDGVVEDMDYGRRPVHVLPTADKQEWKKKMRKARKGSESKREKMPVPEVVGPCGIHLPLGTIRGLNNDGIPIVIMPLKVYKDTVAAEVDSIARKIYYYYSHELKCFDELRMNAHKDCFFWHEKTKVLEKVLGCKDARIATLEEEKRKLQEQIDGEKKLKRQRRSDKRQRRKAEKTSHSASEEQASQAGETL